jgi:hypothetical protein
MDDFTCISQLTASFAKQLAWYGELSRIAQKVLSQLVLSRGDAAAVMAGFLQKRAIVDMIAQERGQIREIADFYQKRKEGMKPSALKNDLDLLLAKSEAAIREFLDGEDQLKRRLEFMMDKSQVPSPETRVRT